MPAGSPPGPRRSCRPGGGSATHSERSCPIAAPATNNEPRINDRIRAREVRLVAEDGEQIGIRPLPEALGIARDQDLDLVEVAPNANPPVCRIMDSGKFKYEAAPRLDGRNMTRVLAPDKRVQAEWARRQAEEAAEAAGGGNGATAPQPDPEPQPAPATTAQE